MWKRKYSTIIYISYAYITRVYHIYIYIMYTSPPHCTTNYRGVIEHLLSFATARSHSSSEVENRTG